MKTGHHIATRDIIDNKVAISNHKVAISRSKLSMGSISEKYPVILDDGKTIVYISDKSREREIRLRYYDKDKNLLHQFHH